MVSFAHPDIALEPLEEPWQDLGLMRGHQQPARTGVVRSKAVWGSRATTVGGNLKRMKRVTAAPARRLH
jgi:hypothetical protein